MGLFEQYGIKEVADVTLYSIHKKTDGSGDVYYVPALYLDTLKISTVEKSADTVWAQGGLGNSRLIAWDFGKTINVNLEDALCTPASLGLCWNGNLKADWQDAQLQYNTDVCICRNPVKRISRIEKTFYPREDRREGVVSRLLPQVREDTNTIDQLDLLKISSVVDGTKINGTGICNNRTYRWKMAIESRIQSIAVVPDRFFDVTGKSYRIDQNRKVSATSLSDYENYKQAIIYRINGCNPCVLPPLAKIIFDYDIEKQVIIKNYLETVEIETDKTSMTLSEIISNIPDAVLYENGVYRKIIEIENTDSNDTEANSIQVNAFFMPFLDLSTEIDCTSESAGSLIKVFNFNALSIDPDSELGRELATFDIVMDIPADVESSIVNYLQNACCSTLFEDENGITQISDNTGNVKFETTEKLDIKDAKYLAIIIDNNNNYKAIIGRYEGLGVNPDGTAYIGQQANNSEESPADPGDIANKGMHWYTPSVPIDTSEFKGIDMWLRFQSINEMIYFMITKYENDIEEIVPSHIYVRNSNSSDEDQADWAVNVNYTEVNKNDDEESFRNEGKLWAYINPRTMQPYADDYWFHYREPIYVKSLTIAPKDKVLKAQRITVSADQWPGMYMMVGETYIRDRDTGDDERLQIKIPLCKVKSDHTLTLQADGDPTTFNLNLEVARPQSGVMMELTSYEVAEKLLQGDNGCFYAVDGSTEVLTK